MYNVLLFFLVFVAISLVVLIIVQQGKGFDISSSFATNASGTLFGSSGSGNFITRMTAVMATLFFIISLVLGNINSNQHKKNSWENLSRFAQEKQIITAKPIEQNNSIPQ